MCKKALLLILASLSLNLGAAESNELKNNFSTLKTNITAFIRNHPAAALAMLASAIWIYRMEAKTEAEPTPMPKMRGAFDSKESFQVYLNDLWSWFETNVEGQPYKSSKVKCEDGKTIEVSKAMYPRGSGIIYSAIKPAFYALTFIAMVNGKLGEVFDAFKLWGGETAPVVEPIIP